MNLNHPNPKVKPSVIPMEFMRVEKRAARPLPEALIEKVNALNKAVKELLELDAELEPVEEIHYEYKSEFHDCLIEIVGGIVQLECAGLILRAGSGHLPQVEVHL